MGERRKPEAACREKEKSMEKIKASMYPFRELNGLWSCFDSGPGPDLLL